VPREKPYGDVTECGADPLEPQHSAVRQKPLYPTLSVGTPVITSLSTLCSIAHARCCADPERQGHPSRVCTASSAPHIGPA
jgi:hypothetical protein